MAQAAAPSNPRSRRAFSSTPPTFRPQIKVSKGTLVMPSLVAACRQGFSNPDVFDPDRFDPAGRDEGAKFQANFLPFGVGAHYCVGREYAMNHLMAFIAIFATSVKWTRKHDGQ
jgi:cytochrome P450